MNGTSAGSTVVELPRRVGFFVRMRARAGLLPGHVSTATLVQARRLRRTSWYMIPVVVVFLLIPVGIVASSHTDDDPAVVAAVLGPTDIHAAGAYEIVLDNGETLFFDSDPKVTAGAGVLRRHRGTSRPIGLVVDGHYVASRADHSSSAVPLAFFFVFYALLLGVFLGPTVVWGRRAYHQLRADLNAPFRTGAGTYVGSWTWRGLSTRIRRWNPNTNLGGFPVAIEEQPGTISWYNAPLELLTEVRHFETQLATGNRRVVATFHPNTRTLAKLDAQDGRASIDLQRSIDELHPETGLSLKVSRRPKHAHLPDF